MYSFGKTPLLVTIHGQGRASGKTTLQFLLADFLKSRGHPVHVSDEKTEEFILKRSATMYRKQPDRIVPNPIYLHVSDREIDEPTSVLDGRTPLEWR